VVVAVESHAARAGVAMLEHGGNAVDAAVAVAYALAVTHPSAGNIGGGGFMLYRPKGGRTVVVDFRETSPHALTTTAFDKMIKANAVGPAAVAVPGSVAGLNLASSKFGKLPRSDVMAPAIELAKNGFSLGRYQALSIQWAWPDLARDVAASKTFGRKGQPIPEGSRLVQRELGKTLERIAKDGDGGFYAGETARAITDLGGRGGLISLEDLAKYRPVIREPMITTFHGLTVEVPPPPSAGGVAVVLMLEQLEKLGSKSPPFGADDLHEFAEVARRAHAIRRFEVGDPDAVAHFDVGVKRADWLRELATFPPFDPAHATPSAKVHPLYEAAMRELEHTTHFSVVDGEGNTVSCTTTLSASFGSKTMAAGIVLNNAVAAFGTVGENGIGPDRHMTTSMSPAIVRSGDDTVLVTGSPGGDTIPNTVVQVIRNVVERSMPLDDAIDAPRIHQGFVPDDIRYERGRAPKAAVLAELRRRGHKLSAKTNVMGDANSVLVSNGTAYGYADPREGGTAVAR
jgi:gamma-glutamyltranspeptidase/glutathione hydrolase